MVRLRPVLTELGYIRGGDLQSTMVRLRHPEAARQQALRAIYNPLW